MLLALADVYLLALCLYVLHGVHTGMFTEVLMLLTFMFIPTIYWYLFSVWLFPDSQFTMYKSGKACVCCAQCTGVFLALYISETA